MTAPYLSIVIPAYNEEQRLPHTLEDLNAFIIAQPYTTDVLVVENGSSDRTLALAQEAAARYPWLRVLHEDQNGKGLAVKRGMLAAQGEYRFICDADFSMPVDEINHFLPPALKGVAVAIGSREAPGAVRYNEPAHRHLIGRGFNLLVKTIVLPGLQDTQCGFKCFSAEAAEAVFPRQTMTGWIFDVEVLFIARRMGFKVQEVPISWYYGPGSRIRVLRDSARMALDLLRIRWKALRGVYDTPR